MTNLTITIEKGDRELFAWVDIPGHFFYSTVGTTEQEISYNIRELIPDYILNEGATQPDWNNINADDIKFHYEVNLEAFFETFDVLKINAVAALAGINKSLLRQYASGVKNASKEQALKIEHAIHHLAETLLRVSVM